MSPAWWSPVVSNRSQRSILLASNTATRNLQRGNVSTASLATDPIRGAAQNLVGRGKACSVGYAGLEDWGYCMIGRGQSGLFDEVRTLLRPNRLIAAGPPVVPLAFLGAPDTTNRDLDEERCFSAFQPVYTPAVGDDSIRVLSDRCRGPLRRFGTCALTSRQMVAATVLPF